MTAFIAHTTVDCTDAYALSEWWKPVLGYADPPTTQAATTQEGRPPGSAAVHLPSTPRGLPL